MPRGSVVKKPSGNYAIRYYGPDGRRRFETVGPSKADAQRALTQRLRELDTGAWREPSVETLAEYALAWLEQRNPARVAPGGRGRLASSTFAEYRRALVDRVLPGLGGRTLASLRTSDVDALVVELERDGLAAGTVRNTITPLRKLLADAVRQGKLPSNPAARADLPPARQYGGKEIPLEHTEAIRQALVDLADAAAADEREPDPFYVSLYDVALGTGLRLGELRALRWRDVDRARKLIRIERAFSRRELKQPKTEAGVRAVPLFASVDVALRAAAGRSLALERYAPNELVFSTLRGTPLHESNVNRRVWRPALRRAGLLELGYRWHDLRHTCVSRLVAAGADIKLVQAVAGHASPMITLQRYSHLLDARVTEAADRFDPAIAAPHGH